MIIEGMQLFNKSRRDDIILKIYDTPSGFYTQRYSIYNHLTPTGSYRND